MSNAGSNAGRVPTRTGTASLWARRVLAALVTAVAVVLASGGWTLGKAEYLDDYCASRAPLPATAPADPDDAPPAHLDGPVTVVCEYDAAEPVTVTDPVPLVTRLVAAAIVVGVAFSVARWARRHAG